MKAYYAHCKSIYNTAQEKRDVEILTSLGFEVVNPSEFDQVKLDERKLKGENVMETVFLPEIAACDVVAFRALPDGSISSGVFAECSECVRLNKPLIELPSGLCRRALNLEQTREYLTESGQR